MNIFQLIFMKFCSVMDCCYGKSPLNFGVYPTENGGVL